MKKTQNSSRLVLLVIVGCVFAYGSVMAHCDSEDGPIVPSIRQALDNGDITPLLK